MSKLPSEEEGRSGQQPTSQASIMTMSRPARHRRAAAYKLIKLRRHWERGGVRLKLERCIAGGGGGGAAVMMADLEEEGGLWNGSRQLPK